MRLRAKRLAIAHSAHPTYANIVKKVQFTSRQINKKTQTGANLLTSSFIIIFARNYRNNQHK